MPSSTHTLSEEARKDLQLVNDKLSQTHGNQYDPEQPVYLILLMPSQLPATFIWQAQGPLEWLHLALHQLNVINDYIELLTQLTLKGHSANYPHGWQKT